eukprot:5878219-Alexandrium_andersonii.AAC.1
MDGRPPPVAEPDTGAPTRLHEHVVARQARQTPPEPFDKHEPLFMDRFPEEALVRRLAAFAGHTLAEHIPGVLSEPGESR